nr:NAD-dependent epimerase/dehydratase family protein [uncultured Albidiferax sp.]
MAEASQQTRQPIGVLGASSMVGQCVLSQTTKTHEPIYAFSRQATALQTDDRSGVVWQQIPLIPGGSSLAGETIHCWICIAPISALPAHFAWLEARGARRIVVLSSTSRFTKNTSSSAQEQAIAQKLAEAESQLQTWAESRGIEWIVLRPTLIYQPGQDKNVSEIARFIQRFRFFPVLGKAQGLRQPIHAADVASACVTALQTPTVANRAYNISGGETLPYRSMVGRIFAAQGRVTRVLSIPLWMFKLAVSLLRCLPRYRHWTTAMAERMNRDLVFDHTEATRDFGFQPRAFTLEQKTLSLPSIQMLSNK